MNSIVTKKTLLGMYESIREKLTLWQEVAGEIWKNPELAYQEHFACKKQLDALALLGFTAMENPYCNLDTAYRAEFENGENGPVFAVCAEYDALPGIGHACGHNLICTAAIAAFYAMREVMVRENIAGKVVLLGTPAEESYGGKVKMLEKNCLDGVDAVIMVHPSARCILDAGSTAICRYDVTFHGKAAHASASPELGLNALDAVMLLFNAVNAFRQQMPDCCRVHGIVMDGGEAPNIIPETASCRFFLRSLDQKWMEKLDKRFHDMVRGAELMTATQAEIALFNIPYKGRLPNKVMNESFFEYASMLDMNPQRPTVPGKGSSDFGDFSRKIPGVHAYFAATTKPAASHSVEMREASNTAFALDQALRSAAVMALIGIRFLTDAEYRKEVKNDFEINTASGK